MYLVIKRMVDFILALMVLIIISPIFLIIIISIKLDSKGPVLFKQRRVGNSKTYFTILKFRTMEMDAPKDIPTHLFKDPEQYLTKVGKYLRRTSLDELPQIINILCGTMAFVGPRPALWNQYDLIDERDKYGANNIRPGLTGWAQINGRDELSIEAKAKLDGDYIQKMSFIFDCKCILGTIVSVIKKDGIIEGGIGTIEQDEPREDLSDNTITIEKSGNKEQAIS